MANPTVTLWHNPRCSKSRQALQLLTERLGEERIAVREYLKDPPGKAAVERLLEALAAGDPEFEPHDLLRSKEAGYKTQSLSRDSSKAEIVGALVKDPSLLERPVAVIGKRARIGRPPERVLDLL